MKKKIYLKPEIEKVVLSCQPLLIGSPDSLLDKNDDNVDDFEDLLSRDLEDILFNEFM